MENQEIGEVILKIYEEQKKTNKKIDGVEVGIKELSTEVGKIDKRLTSEIENVNEGLTSEIEKVNKRLTSEVDKINKRLTSEVDKINERLTSEVDKINERLTSEIGQMNRKFESEMKKVNERFDNLELEGKDTREIIKIMQQEIRRLGGDIAVIQHEHGKKLDILFDAVTGNEERNKETQERFENIEKILEKHSNEIYYLGKRA